MAPEDIDKRLRGLEISDNTLKTKVEDIENKLDKIADTHKQQCPFFLYKDELVEKIKFVKESNDDSVEAVETYVDDEIVKINKRIDEHKTFCYWALGIVGSTFIILFGTITNVANTRVQTDTFNNTIEKLSKIQEKQSELSSKIIDDLTQLKVDIGIIKTKLEKK